MLAGTLYKMEGDDIFRLCVDSKEAIFYIEQAHIIVGDIHL